MPTVLLIGKYRIAVMTKDHLPVHVHVYVPGGVARISLGTSADEVEMLDYEKMTRAELRAAYRLARVNRDHLMQEWSKYHGQSNPD